MAKSPQSTRRDRKQTAQQHRVNRQRAATVAARRRQMLTFVGGAVAVALAGVLVLITLNRPETLDVGDLTIRSDVFAEVPTDGRFLGDPGGGAPLTIVEWGDYQ